MGDLSLLSIFYIFLSYASAGIFFGGMTYKLLCYATTPSPLKIPTTPQATTKTKLIVKFFTDIVFFFSLFRGNRWTWIGGYALHIILLFILVRHLRFFIEPVSPLLATIQPIGMYAGLLLPLPLIYLFVRRKAVDRIAYITSWADMFALVLLLLIGMTGASLKLLSHPDVVSVKHFMMGLILLHPVNIPAHFMFLLHFTLVLTLTVYFPFSKFLHAGGVFFSPTTTQLDDTREVRHVNQWAEE